MLEVCTYSGIVLTSSQTERKGKEMATRGIVAKATKKGWEGRYCHWDNYPERMTYALGALVARDGVDKVIQTLITDTASWSQIEPLAKSGTPNLYEDKALVEGYGYAHTDIALDDDGSLFTQDDTELAWCAYLYIIHETHLEVRRIEHDEKGNDVTIFEKSYPWENIAIVVTA